ncbi:PREDICTED: uncharacterized protein LOC109162339 [Ipomoea nil]|uniref:uncharacterized protein LOC109162339 n=1 Tax=Ipomoea nil TaxID=35883 RepID=UPI000901A0A4|nr:PREDICTED: uncharacterized protein LOC109162339 [Ipomoea nil]
MDGIQRAKNYGKRGGLIKLEAKPRIALDDIMYKEELTWFQRSREEWVASGDRNTKYYHAITKVKKTRNLATNLKTSDGIWITDEELIQRMNVHMEEIKAALFDMAPYKAPGPDGFHVAFYQKTWNHIGKELTEKILEFFKTAKMHTNWNNTLLALISKVKHPELITQFRPIILCNVKYKIVTKVITNRLKNIMPQVVGNEQSSFVPQRQIVDSIATYQELLHTMRTKRGGLKAMTVKIDIEKAYDRLSWDFLQDTLQGLGMERHWINIIMECATLEQMKVIKSCLQKFEDDSGQKVCVQKSQIHFGKNVNSTLAHSIAQEAGFVQTDNLGRYLGVPSIHGRVTNNDFASLIEKIDGNLEGDCDTIERRIRQFVWRGSIHLVNWETITKPKEQGGIGLRRLKGMNLAFLTKLGWRLHTEKGSRWTKVILGKYMQGNLEQGDFIKKKNCSNLWRGICEAHPILLEGECRNINNNELYWKLEPKGRCSVTSAYRLALNLDTGEDDSIWKSIWKLKVPRRINSFVWLLKHKTLMTNAERKHHGFIVNGRCTSCYMHEEDILHCLRDCAVAKELWEVFLPYGAKRWFYRSNFDTWLTRNVTGKLDGGKDGGWSVLFVIIAWWTWKWRCNKTFNDVC